MSKITYNSKKALKLFTIATAKVIENELKNITDIELLSNIFLQSDDKEIKDLIERYEKQLILSKIDFEKFKNELHVFFLETDKYIKNNNLYKKFFKLVNMSYINLRKKDARENIINAYHDLLVQQYSYMAGGTKKVIYGVKEDGSIMYMSEIGQYLSEINYELNFAKSSQDLYTTFSKYGYKVKDKDDIGRIITNDQMITNMLFQMSYYINEYNEYLIQKPFRNPTDLPKIHPVFNELENINNIRERLTKRQTLLPSQGITALLKNVDINSIYMKEELINDVIIMLFKIKFNDNSYTFGYYDTYNKVFYDMWDGSSHEDFIHKPLENLVLQVYLKFTCKLTLDEYDLLEFIETNDFTQSEHLPLVKYEIKEIAINNNRNNHTRNFNKKDYQEEFRHVQAFLRKLPIGASASEEVINLANRMGIDLPKGMTFVKDFRKKVYVKE